MPPSFVTAPPSVMQAHPTATKWCPQMHPTSACVCPWPLLDSAIQTVVASMRHCHKQKFSGWLLPVGSTSADWQVMRILLQLISNPVPWPPKPHPMFSVPLQPTGGHMQNKFTALLASRQPPPPGLQASSPPLVWDTMMQQKEASASQPTERASMSLERPDEWQCTRTSWVSQCCCTARSLNMCHGPSLCWRCGVKATCGLPCPK